MANQYTTARPYAKAVFQQAKEDASLENWADVLQALSLVTSDHHVISLYENPNVTKKELNNLIYGTLQEIVSEPIKELGQKLENFLALLFSEKRLLITDDIYVIYSKYLTDYKKVIEIEVVSPFALGESQRSLFYQALERRFASKVSIHFFEDRSLIGGALVRSGNWVLDGSVRGKIARLEGHLR